ncbi:MAG: hypothetical protein GY820_06850 [Gammaproteobacteria bacterium]|nr:hypothetical protein [Gammaproteobacteria bacterium]
MQKAVNKPDGAKVAKQLAKLAFDLSNSHPSLRIAVSSILPRHCDKIGSAIQRNVFRCNNNLSVDAAVVFFFFRGDFF